MADNIFAPPTKDEMDNIFAPPSKEELNTHTTEKTSIPEAIKTFGLEGASFGLDDELAGALEAAGQLGGVKGLGAPNLSDIEVNTENALDLNKILENYRSARDRRRQIKEQQRQDRPGTALAANIAGSMLTGKVIPGPVAQGAMAGFGASDADITQGDIGKAAVDTALGAGLGKFADKAIKYAPAATMVGAGTGALVGGATALNDDNVSSEDVINKVLSGGLIGASGGAALGSSGKFLGKAGQKIGDKITASIGLQQGLKEGLKGTDITSPQFGEEVYSGVKNLTQAVTDPILQQKQAEQQFLANSKDLFEKQKLNTIKKFENEINDLTTSYDEFKNASLAKQAADKQGEFEQLSTLTNKVANEFDDKLLKLEKQIGKDIEAIYNKAGDKFQTPINLTDVVSTFRDSIPEEKLTPKIQKTLTSMDGDVSLKDSKHLRDLFWSLRNDSDSNVRQAARDAYNKYNVKVQDDLTLLNPDLGAALKLNNSKWSAASKVRDNFINYKDEVESGVHGVINQFSKSESLPNSPEQAIAKSKSKEQLQNLINTLQKASPELAEDIQKQGTELGSKFQQLKAKQPIEPAMPEEQTAKLQKLKDMLEQTKLSKFEEPAIDKKFTQFNDDPLNVAQKFMNYLQKGQEDKEGLALKEEMDTFFKDLTDAKGEDFVNNVKEQMSTLSDKYKIYTPELKLSDVFTKAGIGRTALKGSAIIGNKIGLGAKAVMDSPVGQVGKKTALIGENIKNYISPENINRLRMSPDSTSQALATMLEKIQQLPESRQNAAIFALTQNPVYRNKLNSQEGNR